MYESRSWGLPGSCFLVSDTFMSTVKKVLLVSVIAIFLLSGFYGFFLLFNNGVSENSQVANQSGDTSDPVRLMIPSIGVDAPIDQVGLAADGTIGVPSGPYDVAWFNRSPKPGELGSAIITGHYGQWKIGVGSVFDRLSELKTGDRVYVQTRSGTSVVFTVVSSQLYNPTDSVPQLFKKDGYYLDLISCQGDWIESQKTYTKRLVVFTQAV